MPLRPDRRDLRGRGAPAVAAARARRPLGWPPCAESWDTSGRTMDGTALDVVMEGLARLEYRGYDSAGVALVDGDHVETRKKAPASSPTSRAALEAHPLAGVDDRHRPHPLGHPRRPHRRERPPAPRRRRRQARPHPQRHHRELPRPQAGAARRRRRVPSETDTEVVAHLRRGARTTGCGDLTDGDARRRARPRGRVHAARDPRRPARRRRRRPPQQPARRRPRRRRELPRLRRRGVHRPHPPRARARPGPDRHDHPRRRYRSSTSTARPPRARPTRSPGTPPPPRRAATRPSWRRRSTTSRTPWPTRCSGRTDATAGSSSTRCASPRSSCARSTASPSSPAAPPPTPAWSRSTPSSTGRASPSRSSLAHEFRYCDPIVDGARSSSRSASPARRWTP